MTRTTPLLLLGLLAACSDLPEMMGPEADQSPAATEILAGDPILDAIERIAPALEDRSTMLELQAALRGFATDPRELYRILARLDADPAFAADADAIRLAIATR